MKDGCKTIGFVCSVTMGSDKPLFLVLFSMVGPKQGGIFHMLPSAAVTVS